jgi:transcription initiation factor TFIIIB Brf1 subunit/transcription initiation factor TFIIB
MSDRTDLSFYIDPALMKAIGEVLSPGETIEEFVAVALSGAASRRRLRRDFISRAMASGAKARESGRYVSVDKVLSELDAILKRSQG